MQSRLRGGIFVAALVLGIANHASAGQMGTDARWNACHQCIGRKA
jgi:hypothetical protein